MCQALYKCFPEVTSFGLNNNPRINYNFYHLCSTDYKTE